MSSNETSFRTVAFGGFHKQDVLDYITAANRESQEKSTGLTRRAESAEQENTVLQDKLESAEAAWKKNAAECERLSELLTQRTAALEQAERELAALRQERGELTARLARMEERLPALEADAQSYAALKDHTATIELDARRKAQEIVDQAQERAVKARGELEGWLRRVQSSYQHLRTDVTATAAHLSDELERGRAAMDAAVSAFRLHDETLTGLMDSERAGGPKAPEPLPLEDVRTENDLNRV